MARNKYPEETRNLIIDTASRLFAEQGYEHTSIQNIIDNLGGLSKGAIYHHFSSKEEIMMAVAEKLYSGSEVELKKICKRTDLNGKERLREVFKSSINSPSQKQVFSSAPDMMKNPQLLVIYMQDTVQKESPEIVQKILEEGIEDGSIQTEYPKQLAEVIMLITNMWLNPMVYRCEPEEMLEKMKFYQHLLKVLGLDIIEEEMIETMSRYVDIYRQNINNKDSQK